MHGAAIRRVPLATSDIIEMVHFAAPDTRLVGWCSRACRVLAYSFSRGLDVIPLAQLECFLTFLGIVLSWLRAGDFIIEMDQGSMNKNSPKLVPKHKLI